MQGVIHVVFSAEQGQVERAEILARSIRDSAHDHFLDQVRIESVETEPIGHTEPWEGEGWVARVEPGPPARPVDERLDALEHERATSVTLYAEGRMFDEFRVFTRFRLARDTSVRPPTA